MGTTSVDRLKGMSTNNLQSLIHSRYQSLLGREASILELNCVVDLIIQKKLSPTHEDVDRELWRTYPEASRLRSILPSCWWN